LKKIEPPTETAATENLDSMRYFRWHTTSSPFKAALRYFVNENGEKRRFFTQKTSEKHHFQRFYASAVFHWAQPVWIPKRCVVKPF